MRFSDGLLEEVLRRTDIVQLVGRRVKLERRGRALWGCCPFHKEKSPSFKVENERRAYKCFGCGAGGNAFKFLMETEGLTFREAVEKLANDAGVALPAWSPEDEAREQKKKSLYEIIELAAQFFEAQLREPVGAAARDYLKGRGLDGAAAKQFRLGYAGEGNALIAHLTAKNITLDDIIAAGLARPGEENRGPRDFFFNRVMFPIADGRGRVVAFGARALDPDAKPKYINTGETSLFSKGHMLYNFAPAREAALKSAQIIVAEGYMDVIALVRAGFDSAVAPLGTALTEDQLHLLWRVAPEPILAFDGDAAGLKAAHRAARLSLGHLRAGHSLRFAFLPEGEDPDTYVKAAGALAMKKILDDALPLAQLLWRAETEGRDFSTPERRAGLERALADIVSQIADKTIADYYRRDFDQKVFDAFKRRQPSPTRQERGSYGGPGRQDRPRRFGAAGPARPMEAVSPALKSSLLGRSGQAGARRMKEIELAKVLLAHPELAARHDETLAQLVFSDRQLDRLRHELLNLAASGSRLESKGLENHLVRQGMAELLVQLGRRAGETEPPETAMGAAHEDDFDARFLRAAQDLRDMAEREPERVRALERFKTEGTEESWRDAQRLFGPGPTE
jgi:DNA primase